jgi:hypothetical protein
MIEKIYFPPPIYRLDKVNTYMISKLHNYLTKSKEISKDVFDEAIFTKIFIKDEIEQSKKELLEVGKNDRRSRIEPLTMGFDRSAYEYSKDPELIELEKQFFKFYIISLKKHLQKIKRKEKPEAVKPDEVYKTQNLFKVGLLFATGKMNKYFTVNSNETISMNSGYSAPKIAKELGFDCYNKYILASINNYTIKENRNKNIFNNLDMMTKIISDCKAKNIPVEDYFISRLPIE